MGTSVSTVAVGSGRLVVMVTSQDGRPVANAQVNLFGVNTEPGVSTSSEAYNVSRVGFTDDQGLDGDAAGAWCL